MTMRPMRLMTRRSSDRRRLALVCAGWLALCLGSAAAQQPGSAPTEGDLKSLLKSSTTTLRSYTAPDNSLIGTLYLGLLRDGKPVGYEVFTTDVVPHGSRKVYRFDDRAILVTPDGSTVRVASTGLSEPSFNGIESTLRLVVGGKRPAALTVRATRIGDTIRVKSSPDARDKAPEGATSQTLQVNTSGQVVALSGELQRLVRVRKWRPGDIVALWHLDAVNGNMNPVVLRAVTIRTETSARKLDPISVETWVQQEKGFGLQGTTCFDPDGSVALITKPDGLVKLVLTKSAFEKDWSQKFPWPD